MYKLSAVLVLVAAAFSTTGALAADACAVQTTAATATTGAIGLAHNAMALAPTDKSKGEAVSKALADNAAAQAALVSCHVKAISVIHPTIPKFKF